jgi:predicted translin family RNA/ssDNA-binding protein
MSTVYNSNRYISHIVYDWTALNYLYTQQIKTQSLQTLKQFVKYMATRYRYTVHFVHLNRETTLLSNFKKWADIKEITIERSLSYTAEQNSAAEQSEGVII